MHTPSRRSTFHVARALLPAALALALAAGCARDRSASTAAGPLTPAARAADDTPRILVDGMFEEWPAGRWIVADQDWIYFRVRVEDTVMPLQAAGETLALWLDADDDGSTGAKMPYPPAAAALGVDLAVEFSPADPAGGVSRGARVVEFDATGTQRTELSHTAAGLGSAPTHAASEFEVRLSRHSEQGRRFERGMGARGGDVTAMFALVDPSGKVVGWSDPETRALPRRGDAPPQSGALIPPKPPGAVRILAHNVQRGGLVTRPQPFARLLGAIQPDVILIQEWDTDAASAASWFSATVTGRPAWNALAGEGGVVIVSPWPIEPMVPAVQLDAAALTPGDTRAGVRFVSGLVKAPEGDLIAASLHLKCCGTADSAEDVRRLAEARAINAAIASAATGVPAPLRVVGGDFNLVGSRPPIDLLRAGLDGDGSDLGIAEARVLGDGSMFTWRDASSEFPPGRLDFLTYGDAGAVLLNAFVVDTAVLSDAALQTMGLDRGDSLASDHLPLVIDLKAK